MRVFVEKLFENEVINVNFNTAVYGFSYMGWEVNYFVKDIPEYLSKDDIVVGYISTIKRALIQLGIEPPLELDYPEELSHYYGRKIWKSNIDYISIHPELYPVFIKPIKGKQFDGRLVSSFKDLIGTGKKDYSPEIWCAEPVNFISEYRCFIRYGKIGDMRRYKGDWKIYPNINIIESCLKDFIKQPAGFSMDFGITDDGRTLLIEINDGFSLGSYGLFYIDYAKLISARWYEMVGIHDKCLF